MTEIAKFQMAVHGMHCANCAAGLTKTLSSTPGIVAADVNFGTETATITLDLQKIGLKAVRDLVNANGFSINQQKITVSIGGMHCASCAQRVRSVLLELPHVSDAVVNPSTETAFITLFTLAIPSQELRQKILNSGYTWEGIVGESGAAEREQLFKKEQRLRLIRVTVAFGVSIPLMILMYLPSMYGLVSPFIVFILTLSPFLFVSFPIYKTAFLSLRNKVLSMDVMYALGISAAFCASMAGTFGMLPSHEFMLYETSIMLAGFLTLGRYLEANARGKTSLAIEKLINLQPKSAIVISDGKEESIPVDTIVKGMIILVKPGDQIPVDGTVENGESTIDEAMISGEPLPVYKKYNSAVTAGTINKSGVLYIRTDRTGKDTVLARIIKLVREAQGSRPPVQLLADKVVALFIPVILSIAALTFVFWYVLAGASLLFSLTTFIAVIVIACPCALGLASPTAITVGIGRGAELGILIKNGEVLEKADTITTVVFDKTGTLTEGKPEVTYVKGFDIDVIELLCLAASVEKNSLHPLADAIVKKAQDEKCVLKSCEKFFTIEGLGVQGIVDNSEILCGNQKLMIDNNVELEKYGASSETVQREGQAGVSTVFIAINKKVAGSITIADKIRDTAKQAVVSLQKMGIDVIMLTGDNPESARNIAAQAGIVNIIAGVLPDKKALSIRELQEAGKKVAFVGDGINDAPALAQADIGIAVGNGTDIAIETGGIVLVKNDPLDAVASLQFGKKILGRIKLNLFWAFAYNTALIPLAAGALKPWFNVVFRPELAGFAMALSSVTVVTLSLLLKNYIPPVLANKGKPA